MSDQKDKGAEYKVFLESCLGGSVDDTDGHDKRLLGPIGEILEEKEDKDSDSKDDAQKNTTVCFNLNDSENESSGFGDDDDDDEWDLEDAYNFDAEKIAELLQKGGEINEEELVETMQESMAEAMFLRMNLEDPDLEAERPDCSGTLDGRMTPPAKDAKDFDAATPPDPKVLAEKLEMKDRRRSSISGRRNINDAVKTNTARTRKSIACIAAEKTASGADKATIELAAEKTTKRHRMSLCKAAETLDLAGLGDDAPEEVQKKINMISKCLMVARGRHRMNVAAAVKETICGESDEEETKTAKSEGKSNEAKSSKDGPSDSKEASAPKATPKPKFMSKLRACAKEFQPSEKQLSIKQKIAAAVAAAYKRNGPVEKPEKSEVKEEWTTAYEDMSLYGYEDYSWQGQYGCDGSYGWNQMNCNQMGCNQMACNQMGYNQMAYNQMQYQQTGYNQMACGGCGMGCQGRNQWQGNQWQGQAGWNGNDGQYDSYGNYVGPGNYGNDYNNCYYNNYGGQAQNNGYGGNWQNAAWGSA